MQRLKPDTWFTMNHLLQTFPICSLSLSKWLWMQGLQKHGKWRVQLGFGIVPTKDSVIREFMEFEESRWFLRQSRGIVTDNLSIGLGFLSLQICPIPGQNHTIGL